jgi:uncharacterized protein
VNIKSVRQAILPVLKRRNIIKASLFGSLIHGKLRDDSDIDVLVELPKESSLLDYLSIKDELEHALGRTVDLVEYDAIKPFIRETILAGQVPIYPKMQ